jgi:hypothetical protein
MLIVLVMGTLMYGGRADNGYTAFRSGVLASAATSASATSSRPTSPFIASIMMLLGWGALAVPTGIAAPSQRAE